MTVRFSCRCPNADYLGFEATPESIIATAEKAEELGFDAVFVNDHLIVDGLPGRLPGPIPTTRSLRCRSSPRIRLALVLACPF